MTPAKEKRERKTYGVTLSDLIDAGQVGIGERLTARHKGEDYFGVVTANGCVKLTPPHRMTDSPSRTASAVTVYESNGWLFWKVPRLNGCTLASLRDGRS